MIFRFAVVRFVKSHNVSVGVCGSIPELGSWNPIKAVKLKTSNPLQLGEPAFWDGQVDIRTAIEFEYKFVCFFSNGTVEFEGCGQAHNRTYNCENTTEDLENGVYMLRPTHWKERTGESSEVSHTTAFYHHVICDHSGIHFSKINEALWLGSAPRQFYHVAMLKGLGVSAVVTMQTESDLERNCLGVLSGSQFSSRFNASGEVGGAQVADALADIYQHHGIVFVWMPTEDMSTQGRVRMLPQGVLVLQGLLAGGHRVYVHCNAGVGRSTAVVAGLLHFVHGMSIRSVEYLIGSRRPAVFFDAEALNRAADDFQLKYGAASKVIRDDVQKQKAESV